MADEAAPAVRVVPAGCRARRPRSCGGACRRAGPDASREGRVGDGLVAAEVVAIAQRSGEDLGQAGRQNRRAGRGASRGPWRAVGSRRLGGGRVIFDGDGSGPRSVTATTFLSRSPPSSLAIPMERLSLVGGGLLVNDQDGLGRLGVVLREGGRAETAAATDRPFRSTPRQEPSVTFQAMTAWWPVMKTSALEKQGPV